LWRINHSSQSKVVDPKKNSQRVTWCTAGTCVTCRAEPCVAGNCHGLQSKRISISPVSPSRPPLAATRASSTTPISPLLSLCLFSFLFLPVHARTSVHLHIVQRSICQATLPYASSTPTVSAVVSPGLAPGRTVTSPTAPLSATNTIFIRGASHAACRRLFPHVHEKLPAATKAASKQRFRIAHCSLPQEF
jgi:hypothetical protein